jgi:hypothetical protein
VKDENGDMLADTHYILNRWKNYFTQLLQCIVSGMLRQIEIHTAEPLVPGSSHLEVEIATGKLKKYKTPGTDQIPEELSQAGDKRLLCMIHRLINSIWNKEELPNQWKESIILQIYKRGNIEALVDARKEVGLDMNI